VQGSEAAKRLETSHFKAMKMKSSREPVLRAQCLKFCEVTTKLTMRPEFEINVKLSKQLKLQHVTRKSGNEDQKVKFAKTVDYTTNLAIDSLRKL
jgi:hypothetical protein